MSFNDGGFHREGIIISGEILVILIIGIAPLCLGLFLMVRMRRNSRKMMGKL